MTAPAVTAAGNRSALIYQPDSAVFWVFVAALALGLGRLLALQGSALHETLDANLELVGIWLAFIVFMVWLMLRFDPFRAMRPYPQVLAASTALGAATATAMAIDGNDALDTFWSAVLPPQVFAAWSAALTAPFVEEAAKAGCATLVLVLCGSVLNRIAHALIVGMFTGFGFDVSEDLGYVAQGAIGSLDSDVIGAIPELGARILTAVPAHWSYTGLTTVGVFLLLPTFSGRTQWPPARRVPAACGLMLCGPLLHFVWDSPLNDGVFTIVGSLAFFVAIVLLLLRFERRWVVARILEGRDAGWLADVDGEVLDSLPTFRQRSRLRRAARRRGGRAAKKAVAAAQRRALDLIQTTPAMSTASTA